MRRNQFMSIILWIGIITCLNVNAWALYPEVRITIKVIDEDGSPIEGVRVGIGFEENTGWGTKEIPVVGFTDASGVLVGTANANNYVGFNAGKNGYYKSYGKYLFLEKKSGRWEPWNPEVTVVLRKIENPVPMYARYLDIEIPIIGKEVGFDLIEYDWVMPYGKGKYSDFIFKLEKEFKSRDEFNGTLTVTVPNKFNGIQIIKENRKQGSQFKLPRFAPLNGYQQKLMHFNKALLDKPITTDFDEDNNYIFRIRSEEKDGKLIRAMYGKIHGDIRFDPMNSKTAYIGFKYFLNPDYTKNLEFDPKQNLFKNLKSTEEVGLE